MRSRRDEEREGRDWLWSGKHTHYSVDFVIMSGPTLGNYSLWQQNAELLQ